VVQSENVLMRFREFHRLGVAVLDSAHLAFAEASGCEVLITCDDRFIKRAKQAGALIRVMNPLEYIDEVIPWRTA
jgi:predicted nucleic acid-binding protein